MNGVPNQDSKKADENMRLRHLLDKYFQLNRSIRSESTKRVYRVALNQFEDAIERIPTIEDLTDDNLILLEKFLDDGVRSPYTINERTGRIKALWRWAAKRGYVKDWPTVGKMREPEPLKPILSIQQMQSFLNHLSTLTGMVGEIKEKLYWTAYHLVLWDSGERSGALKRLKWEWLLDQEFCIPAAATKDGKNHIFPIHQDTMDALDAIRQPERALVFPWDSGCFHKAYKSLVINSGLPYIKYKSGPHRWRRTFANAIKKHGGDPTDALNHSSPAVTRRFYLQALSGAEHPNRLLPRLSKEG